MTMIINHQIVYLSIINKLRLELFWSSQYQTILNDLLLSTFEQTIRRG